MSGHTDKYGVSFDQIEEFRREQTIPSIHGFGKPIEPWAVEENRVLNAICNLARSTLSAGRATEASAKLTTSLNMHNRSAHDAAEALSNSRGHVCEARVALEGIKNRSDQVMKDCAEWAPASSERVRVDLTDTRNIFEREAAASSELRIDPRRPTTTQR